MEILQRFQNGYLRIIVNAPWYVINLHHDLYHDLNLPYVRDEIIRLNQRYANKVEEHPNILAKHTLTNFMKEVETKRRLKRKLPQDLCI